MGFFNETLELGTDILISPPGIESVYLIKYDATGTYQWSLSFACDFFIAGDIEADPNGNVYMVLSYSGSMTTGTTTINNPGYIAKISTAGNILWYREIESSPGYCRIPSLEINNQGNLTLAGVFESSFVLDTISRTIPDYRMYGYLIFMDTTGSVSGIRHVTNDDSMAPMAGIVDLEIDDQGSTLLLMTDGNMDFGNGVILGACAMAIVNYDNNMNCQWEMHTPNTEWGDIMDLHVSDSYIYVTGLSLMTMNIDTVSVNHGTADMFILKTNKTGSALWLKTYGVDNYGFGLSLSTDFQENIYLLGGFTGTITLGSDVMTSNGYINDWAAFDDVYLSKFDSEGNPLWARNAGDVANRGFGSIYTSVEGDIFFVGYEVDTLITKTEEIIKNSFVGRKNNSNPPADADNITGPSSVCENQTGVVYTVPEIINASSYEWTLPAFATGSSTTNTISVDFATGTTGTISVKGVNANGNGAISEMTVNASPATSSSINVISCNNYTAPDNQEYSASGTYTAIIPNAAGCDSTITINLTITQSTASTITVSECDTYIAPDSQEYTASGTYTAIIPNAAGCDSTITINLTVNTTPDPIVTFVNDTLFSSVNTGNQWYDDNGIITGSTDSIYIPVVNGNYYTIVTLNGCSGTSTVYNVTTIGIESMVEKGVMIYPNPSDGQFVVSGNKISSVIIYDLTGRKVFEKYVSSNTTKADINISYLPSGIYSASVGDNGSVSTFKLVIVK